MKKGKRSVAIQVPEQYLYGGAALKKAIDTLFPVLWEQLSLNKQAQLEAKYSTELEILNMDCE